MSTLPKLSGLLSWLLPKSRLAELQMPGSAQLPTTHSCSHTGDKSLLGAEVRAFPRNLSGAITHRQLSPQEGQTTRVYHLRYKALPQRTPGKPNGISHPVTTQGGGRNLGSICK